MDSPTALPRGLNFAAGSNNHLPPTGSAEALLGTNPIAIAIHAAADRAIRESQRLPGFERIWLPGEQSHTKWLDRLTQGILIPLTAHKNLDELA